MENIGQLCSAFAEAAYAYHYAYMAKVNNLATCFVIVAIVIAIVLGLLGDKKACVIWLIFGTIFWFFGGFGWLAAQFISY